MHHRTRRTLLIGAALAPLATARAQAQGDAGFPDRAIRMVVPVPPGGVTDALARAIGRAAQPHLGQQIVADNRPGAGGTLGPSQMARTARPDGYTIGTVNSAVLRMPLLNRVDYDPVEDFTYIIRLAGFAYGVLVRPDAPWRSWQELVAFARANPGKVAYGSSGIGSAGHIGMEQIGALYGLQWLHVPYRGWAENASALLAGDVQISADASWTPMVEGGQLRALVVWSDERLRRFPAVPTLRQSGMDLAITLPFGIAGPRGIPAPIVRRLHDAFRQAMQNPDYLAVAERYDMIPEYLDSADYTRYAAAFYDEQKTLLPRIGLTRS